MLRHCFTLFLHLMGRLAREAATDGSSYTTHTGTGGTLVPPALTGVLNFSESLQEDNYPSGTTRSLALAPPQGFGVRRR